MSLAAIKSDFYSDNSLVCQVRSFDRSRLADRVSAARIMNTLDRLAGNGIPYSLRNRVKRELKDMGFCI